MPYIVMPKMACCIEINRKKDSRHRAIWRDAGISYSVPFLSQEEVADIPVLDPVSAHIELIEENYGLLKVIADFHASMESATRNHWRNNHCLFPQNSFNSPTTVRNSSAFTLSGNWPERTQFLKYLISSA